MNKQKPKLATITFHRAINYGAVLQTYALQEIINKLGGNCTVLDYRNELLESKHREMKLSNCRSLKDYIKVILLSSSYNRKYKLFREFSNNFLNLSTPFYHIKELEEIVQVYDKFITGSDQVWNHNITNTDPAYFLSFVGDGFKKNSYAASFGISEIEENKKDIYYKHLSNFNNMSVREKQGAKIIKQLLDRDVEIVLDPTMLLTKEDWYSIDKSIEKHKDYILIYGFGNSKTQMEFARKLSQKSGYKILQISNPYYKQRGIIYEKHPSPQEFLGLFKDAKYIITNSFHGTAFSIIFNKEFFTELLPRTSGVNSRLEDILGLFDLRDRLILSDDISICNNPIDYDRVNKLVEHERAKSTDILKKIIYT